MRYVEDIFKKILAGQENVEKQLTNLVQEVQSVKEDVKLVKEDLQLVKEDVLSVKEVVKRIEHHQEGTIMGMLSHIIKQVEIKES